MTDDSQAKLERFKAMYESGLLEQAEFDRMKGAILAEAFGPVFKTPEWNCSGCHRGSS